MRTRSALFAPLARTPAVLPGSYLLLAIVGGTAALLLEAAILWNTGVSIASSVTASLAAIAIGLVAAKLWYGVLHPDESILRGGWAVDGFLIVVPVVGVGAIHALGLPMGRVLDASVPGIFVAVAIGRVGCFLAGCCAGRATSSRWGIWSSDRRVGARRIPTQLLESAVGLGIAVISLVLVPGNRFLVEGLVFVAAFAVYFVVRQVLLRLRDEQRRSARSLPATAGAAAAVLFALGMMAAWEHAGVASDSTQPTDGPALGRASQAVRS